MENEHAWWILFTLAGIATAAAIAFLTLWLRAKGRIHINEKEHIALDSRYEQCLLQLAEAKDSIDQLENALVAMREKTAIVETEKRGMEKRIAEHQQDMQVMQVQFKEQFENLSNHILKKQSEDFSKQSEKGLQDILGPFREKFQEFQKVVHESFSDHAKEQYALKHEIKNIVMQTEGLTKALKNDVKTQGNWGEVVLENILQSSGLRKGEDYILQGSGMELKSLDGRQQKPDVIVKLPEDKHIIIDAKVSLTHYERYCSEEDEAVRTLLLKEYVGSVKAHVKGLESRDYQYNEALGTPDIVLMFMPIEGAFSLALQTDSQLQHYAWERKIAIVCPSTLFATLRTIESVWRLERQNRYAAEIAMKGGQLYDKVVGFVEDMQKLGKQLNTAQGTYQDTMKKLSTGRGSIISRTEELEKLGVKSSKKLPSSLVEEDSKLLEVL